MKKYGVLFFLTLVLSSTTIAQIADSILVDNLLKSIQGLPKEKAIIVAQQIEQKVSRSKETILIFKAYRRLGFAFEELNDMEQALLFYEKALTLENDLSPARRMDIYLDVAIVHKRLSHYKLSKDFYTQALALAQKENDWEMVQFVNNGLSTLYEILSDNVTAIHYNLKCIEVAEKRNDKRGMCITRWHLSELYGAVKDSQLAYKNIAQAKMLAESIHDTVQIVSSYIVNGRILSTFNQFEAALIAQKKALFFLETMDDKRLLVECLIDMSQTYTKLERLDEAEACYKRCLTLKSFFAFNEYPNFMYQIGGFYTKKGQAVAAFTSFNEALKTAQERQLKSIIQIAHYALSEWYTQNGNHLVANQHLQAAYAYKDSLYNDDKIKRIAEAQFKYDVEQSEKNLSEMTLRQSRTLLWSGLSFAFLVIGGLAYFLKTNVKSNKVLKEKNTIIDQRNRQLEESIAILRQFAYVSAHDLKEPLRSITSFSGIISRRYKKLLPPEAEEYFDFITKGVSRLEELFNALLEYATLASEGSDTDTIVSSKDVLDEVVRNLESVIKEKNAHITYPDTLPFLQIHTLHVSLLFKNLIGNAIKFSKENPLVHIDYKMTDKEVIFSITDNGIGMKIEYSDKIFLLFQRLVKTPQYESTGTGLTICKNIMDKYEGRIWFESVENEGSTFLVAFPLTIVKEGIQSSINSQEMASHLAPEVNVQIKPHCYEAL